MRALSASGLGVLGWLLGGLLLSVLALPFIALAGSASPLDLQRGVHHPLFWPALVLSLRTSLVSLALVALGGTPVAYWLSTSTSRFKRGVELLIDLPIVIPPAVVGVALLQAFGRKGLLGPFLDQAGIQLPFTTHAVLLAQVVVSAPFFVQAAANAFRKVEPDTLLVARTLGAPPAVAFLRVALPIALPGLLAGASLAWARSLGEFGATLLFAGNLPGKTQTMPLAIFSALERDLRLALVLSIALAALGALLLLLLRWSPRLWELWRSRSQSFAGGRR